MDKEKVTVTEVKKAFNGKITIFGGIPSVVLLEQSTSDREFEAFLKRLFSIEKKLDPLSIVMLLRISERLLGIAGQAANDADVIMRMVAKL